MHPHGVRVTPAEHRVRELWPDFCEQWVVYEDDCLIVIDKPAGVPSQAARPEDDDDLVARLRRRIGVRRGVPAQEVYVGVHQRLDKDTSGLILFTLRRECNPAIAAQFEQRQVAKSYIAAVDTQGRSLGPGERVLTAFLARGADAKMRVVSKGAPGARLARTRLLLRRQVGSRALLDLQLDTGRTHQLRVQLAGEGIAIAGDRLYGQTRAPRLLLHARSLRLRHPEADRTLEFALEPPPELEAWLEHGAIDVSDDPALLRRALRLALEQRAWLGRMRGMPSPTTAFRLFHGVADGSKRLGLDLYGDFVVAHLFELNETCETRLLDAIEELGFEGVYLKRHVKQKNELADPRDSRYAPADPVRGRAAPEELIVYERGVPFGVRLGDGLRTGLFLDQRDNRQRVRELAQEKRVLNLFAYTGGFAVAALAGGAAQATCIDASATALRWGQRNVERITAQSRHRSWHTDVFEALPRLVRRGERFDLIILDPPSYATTRNRRFVAARDYATLCETCFQLLAPGGQLLGCINHHGTSQAKLRRDLHQAARAARRRLVQVKDLPPPLDFPAPFDGDASTKSVLVTCE
jgi:23S rRNA (cytosine1962-C5)-methyltransferase